MSTWVKKYSGKEVSASASIDFDASEHSISQDYMFQNTSKGSGRASDTLTVVEGQYCTYYIANTPV